MNHLVVEYNFQTIEAMFRDTVRFREQYLSNNLEVEIKMLIGVNNFQAIFVIQ